MPGYVSFVDAVPPHPTIYTGTIRTSLERYRLMANSTWNMAFPAAVFGPDVVQNVGYDAQTKQPDEVKLPVPLSSKPSASLPPSSSSFPTDSHSTSHHSRPSTSSSRASGKRKAAPTEHCNRFIPFESPIMPNAIEPWTTASRTIGETFDNNQVERPGVSRNYVLPEPYLFAGHSDEGARQAMLKTYLKVREVLFYDILTRGAHNCLRSPPDSAAAVRNFKRIGTNVLIHLFQSNRTFVHSQFSLQ